MNNKNHFRTAAIVYGEDSAALNVKTIHKKIVESAIINNSNKYITISELVDIIEKNYGLEFGEIEILEIVESDKNHFLSEENENGKHICLSFERYELLKNRLDQQNIESHVHKFANQVYEGDLAKDELSNSLYRFLYELLNKNISAFSKIISPDNSAEEITVNADKFTVNERKAINEFLDWDDLDKNRALFSLVSYCIEYSLMSNDVEKASVLLKAITNKVFYLDNNIIYRAIGLNGKQRQNRILNFLSKCTNSGQKLIISKFTYEEFRSTIKYHIKNLRSVGFSKINPKLFSKHSLRSGLYSYYHEWRGNKSTYAFDLFEAHIKSLYDQFKKEYRIDEDYKIPFDVDEPDIKRTLLDYESALSTFKDNNNSEINRYDALNIYLIERKRKLDNKDIRHTKFFFVSTDQKLRNWDFSRNNNQPIALLPSQWMAILLKYYSRTDNDYDSFVSFLRLPGAKPILAETDVNIVLSGISEITEDFERQETLFENFVQEKFYTQIEGLDNTSKKEIATLYAEKQMDKKINEVKSELRDKNLKTELADKKNKKRFIETSIKHKKELKTETLKSISDLEKVRTPIVQASNERFNRFLYGIGFIAFTYFVLSFYFIYSLSSVENLELYFSLAQTAILLFLYLYLYVKGYSNPSKFFESKKSESKKFIFKKFGFNPERLSILNEQLDEVEKDIDELENKLRVIDKS